MAYTMVAGNPGVSEKALLTTKRYVRPAVRIETIGADREEQYENFLTGFEESLFFHSTKYKRLLMSLLGCSEAYLAAFRGDEMVAALPLLYLERDGRRVYNSLPYYSSPAGVLSRSAEASADLISAYRELATARETISSTVVENPFSAPGSDLFPATFKYRRTIQFTELAPGDSDGEALMSRMDGSSRRNVKKSQSAGVTVGLDFGEMDRVRDLHQENMTAIGAPPRSNRFFQLAEEIFEPGRDYDLYVARLDGRAVGGLLCFYFNQTVEYFTPAIDPDFRSIQPLSQILKVALSTAAKRGFTRWNWGGSSVNQVGIYRFKKKWGGIAVPNDYHIHLNDPDVLNWTSSRILAEYPNFFVVPFSEIGGGTQ